MIRNLCIVCLFTCSIAQGQSLLSASVADSRAAIPNSTHTLARVASIPRFEAASIKIATRRDGQVNEVAAFPGRRITCAHCTLQFLATLAFGLQDWQVTGRSEWMSDAPFDLDVSASDQSQPTVWNSQTPLSDGQRMMLQALLIDRFRLAVHHETKADTVYLLERSGPSLKLVAPSHPWEGSSVGGEGGGSIGAATGIAAKNISMPELATRLSRVLKRSVLDRTGLSGTFDFASSPTDMPGGDASDTVIDAMREVGLKLTATSGTVEVLVIDHAEPPPENASTIYTRNPDCAIGCTEIVQDTNPRP